MALQQAILIAVRSTDAGLRRLSGSWAAIFFAICAATYAVNAMDRLIFPAVLHVLAREFHFGLAVGGLLSTIFLFGIGLGGLVIGFIIDKSSRKTAMIAGIVVYSVFTILTPLSFGFYDMLTYRTMTGIGEGVQNVALAAAIGAYYYKNRAFALGLVQCALGLGSFVGPMAGAWLLIQYNDWRLPFYIFGVVGLVGAAAVGIVPKSFTDQRAKASIQPAPGDRLPEGIWNRNVLCLMVTGIFRALVFYAVLALYSTFLIEKLHFSFSEASFALSLFGLGPFLGPVAGYISDKTNPKYVQILAMIAMAAFGYLIFNVATTPLTQSTLAFCEGVVGGVLFVNGYSMAQSSVRSHAIGRVSGIFYASTTLPAAVSGWLLAKLVERFDWSVGGSLMTCYVFIVPILVALLIDTSRLTSRVSGAPAGSRQ